MSVSSCIIMFVDESQRELCVCITHVLWRDELDVPRNGSIVYDIQ